MPKAKQSSESSSQSRRDSAKKTLSRSTVPSQHQVEASSNFDNQELQEFIPPIQAVTNENLLFRKIETESEFSKPISNETRTFSRNDWQSLPPQPEVKPLVHADWDLNAVLNQKTIRSTSTADATESSHDLKAAYASESETTTHLHNVKSSNIESTTRSSELNIESKVVSPTDLAKATTDQDSNQVASSKVVRSDTESSVPGVESHARVQAPEIIIPPLTQLREREVGNTLGLILMFVVGFALAAGCLYATGRLQQQQIPDVIKLVVQADELISKLQLNSSSFALATPGSQVSTTAVVDLESEPHIIPIMGHQTFTDRELEKSALQQERSEEICKALFEENLDLQKNFASA